VFGLPCYKPRERNFLYSFFFFFLFCRRPFGAATAAVDGTKREKNVLGFFFWRAVSLVVTTRAFPPPYFTWNNVFLFFLAKARLKDIRWSADVCMCVCVL
jgi:hypothetical protein